MYSRTGGRARKRNKKKKGVVTLRQKNATTERPGGKTKQKRKFRRPTVLGFIGLCKTYN